ncbi:MAG: hypothetical protein MUF58_18395 [Arcicella sp.]|jgi:hypothetical protein|nr:hypothetical protein [Arcicella sp.]
MTTKQLIIERLKELPDEVSFKQIENEVIKCNPNQKHRVIEQLSTLSDDVTFKQIEDKVFELNPDPIWKNKKGRWFFG